MRHAGYCLAICGFSALIGPPSARAASPHGADAPSVGDSIIEDDVRVTLLDARQLSADEYRLAGCNSPDLWPGGGFHAAFLVENRPGQRIPAVLGEMRILVGSSQYNEVTNATSSKPLAPCVIVRAVDDFFLTTYGRRITRRAAPRAGTVAGIIEVYIRGGVVPAAAKVVIELEQGGTHLSAQQDSERAVHSRDVEYRWFRFAVPPS